MEQIRIRVIALSLALAMGAVGIASAQVTQTTLTTQQTQTTTTQPVSSLPAGVVVDARGVLRTEFFPDQTGQLTRQKIAAARAVLNPQAAATSPLRKVSLNRLEAALKARLEAGEKPTDEMKNLAGLLRVQYVFFYPDTKDIVVAGPAEGWGPDLTGRVRGLATGRPVVQLDDLVTALRAFPPGGTKTPLISVSIDPTPEGLQRMQQFLQKIGSRATPADTQFITTNLKESLGLQTVRITGVPATTHFAQVLVEADYRMKLIGIGLERPPIRQLASYVDRANPTAVSRNALQRWFFVPDYQCVRVSADGQAMELVGDGVKLVNADEIVGPDGTRAASGSVDAASRAFTEGFTKKYAELAAVSPVYAQLRNCIDLAVAAAFLQQSDYYRKADWTMPVLGDESSYAVETLTAPQQVETAVNSVWKGRRLMTPVGGGVVIHPHEALVSSNTLPDDEGKVEQARREVDLSKLAEGQWWWD